MNTLSRHGHYLPLKGVIINHNNIFYIPTLLFWGDKDDITKLGVYFLKSIFRKADDPVVIKDAGYFIQEDRGEEVAQQIVEWMQHK